MKKIILALILIITILPIVNAEIESLPTQQQGTCSNVQQTCSNCTFVTLDSITYPNLTKTYINTNMTKVGFGYNYSFCDTSILGTYIVSTCGDIDGILICANYDFEVIEAGNTAEKSGGNIAGTIVLLVIAIVLIFLSFLFNDEYVVLKIIFLFGGLSSFILTLSFIRTIIPATAYNSVKLLSIGYYLMIILTIITFIIFSILFIIDAIQKKKAKALIGTE